jgi:hypothetical protein
MITSHIIWPFVFLLVLLEVVNEMMWMFVNSVFKSQAKILLIKIIFIFENQAYKFVLHIWFVIRFD